MISPADNSEGIPLTYCGEEFRASGLPGVTTDPEFLEARKTDDSGKFGEAMESVADEFPWGSV